ncbi:hypothetical protein GGH98_002485 [Coemansia sp. RSA 454]|nr:hypothetical protein GGH98_002485 [Coemansia sp. RSA 454]
MESSSSSSYSSASTQLPDRFAESKALAAHYLKDNIDGVQAIAEHSDQTTQQFVTKQAESIAEFIDELVQRVKPSLGKAELENELKATIAAQLNRRSPAGLHSEKTEADMFNSAVRFLKWLCPGSDSTFSKTNEKHVYPCFAELINFVAELVVRPLKDQKPASLDEQPKRLVRSYILNNAKSDKAEDKHYINMALKCDTLNYITGDNAEYDEDSYLISEACLKANDEWSDERPNYPCIFAVVEVESKSSEGAMLKGFSQLVEYSKDVYRNQHNRHFIWGLVSGGSEVKACVLGQNFLLASKFMDVTSTAGRLELIRFLVNWSFCELPKLGYDPTIRYNYKHECFAIDMVNSNEQMPTQTTYYLREVVVIAERVFGRHTRCFVVGRQPPSLDENSDNSGDILIKDAWPEVSGSAEDDMRDESKLLERVSNGLAGRSEFNGLYPKYINGGRMQIQNAHGDSVDETTRTVLGETVWAQLGDLPLRAHMRIAMSGVGEPLESVQSIYELVVVIYDVMRCHMGILKHCQILHRDISEANILVRRDDTGVHGMLIDFDHSIDITDEGYAVRTEGAGTRPFMSINNLEDNSTKRTALDDWESIIYILCWLGTFGWNRATQPSGSVSKMAIASWNDYDEMMNANSKRRDMDSSRIFTEITKGFNPNIPHISAFKKFVNGLRAVLINNHDDPDMRGAIFDKNIISEESDTDDFLREEYITRPDPFVERAAHWESISERLLAKLETYATICKRRISESGSRAPDP